MILEAAVGSFLNGSAPVAIGVVTLALTVGGGLVVIGRRQGRSEHTIETHEKSIEDMEEDQEKQVERCQKHIQVNTQVMAELRAESRSQGFLIGEMLTDIREIRKAVTKGGAN